MAGKKWRENFFFFLFFLFTLFLLSLTQVADPSLPDDSSPHSVTTIFCVGLPEVVPSFSIFLSVSIPVKMYPNTTCFPSSLGNKKEKKKKGN